MAEQEPVLTEAFLTAQSEGKAFTLKYKNRFLYSKYNPQKSILQAVQSLELLPGTLVLVFSPALFYGFEELEQKCKASSSAVLCVEADKGLHDYEKKIIKENALAAVLLPFEENTAQGLDDFFSKSKQKFRRVARLDFSAGVSFYEDFYRAFYECAQNIVAAFWKNRLTLVRLGRLFCKNLFKNLLPAARSIPFDALEKTVEKPILVCGAGESLDQLTALPCGNSFINDKFFVLAVDAALPALGGAGIKIDAAASTESQWAIEKAYIGLKDAVTKNKERPIFFFDLSSRAQIARRFSKNASFYFSEFDKNKFLSRLQKEGLLPASAPPLGSIGLTAVYLALRLRKSAEVPVCVMGLDFSFSAGQTHARGTAQSKALLAQSNRLRPAQNCAAAFAPGTEKILGKDGRACWTSKNLFGYAALFKQYFNGAPALYDLGESGIDLGLEKKRLSDFFTERAASNDFWPSSQAAASNDSGLAKAAGFSAAKEREKKARDFLKKELDALRALADLLSNGEAAKSRDKSIALDKQIMAALDGRKYLYLHFPDGTEAKPERSFLTRVRAQIDFFAKDIETALAVE